MNKLKKSGKGAIPLLLLLLILLVYAANAQQWGMYTLYGTQGGTNTYLVDTNGTTYKSWTFTSTKKNGYSVYLMANDTLLRTVSYQGAQLNGGGRTGEVQKVLWDGTVVWDFVYSSSTYCLHHDICPLPNGNILMISWDLKSSAEATLAGSSSPVNRLSEKIIEVMPTGPSTGVIVWEWKLWDHLCQSYNSAKNNYVASVSANPQLVNLNYKTTNDFFHLNSVDYNPVLDQIVFSAHNYNELYVIDHSTTTLEAASHAGGNSGKGGDILYRWGNPAAYGVTGTAVFNIVHDAHWVSSNNLLYPGQISAFTNKGGTGLKSAAVLIQPPYNGYNYAYTAGQAMPPAAYTYMYSSNYTCNNMGSAQQLDNGNILMCIPNQSTNIIEVSPAGTVIWTKTVSGSAAQSKRYDMCYVRGHKVTASSSDSVIASGTNITLSATVTSVTETNPVYSFSWSSVPSGFLSSGQYPSFSPLETATYHVTVTNAATGCTSTDSVTVVIDNTVSIKTETAVRFRIYPNPTNGSVFIEGMDETGEEYTVAVYDVLGKMVLQQENAREVKLPGDHDQIYFIRITSGDEVFTKKIILDR